MFKITAKLKVNVALLTFAILITQSFTIYLPESSSSDEAIKNQWDAIETNQLQHNFNQQHTNRTANAFGLQLSQRHRHQTSYDKNNDVAFTHEDDTTTNRTRPKRELSDWLIAPNTRWCGRGNTANGTYNHLGGASSADKCCRKHDHCQLYIHGMSNRYDLFNYRPYTLSHCKCDRRFRTCLKMANDEAANTIGKLFFNMVQTQCFILRSEKVCQQRKDDGSCVREVAKHKAYLKNNRKF